MPLNLLTKIAIADARGVCFEYAPRRIIPILSQAGAGSAEAADALGFCHLHAG